MNPISANMIISRTADDATSVESNLHAADERTLHLESFLKLIIQDNLKRQQIMKLAKESNITLSYTSINRYLNQYRKHGLSALLRKERKGKGTPLKFSTEVTRKMIEIFSDKIRGGVAVRAYWDTHDWLRTISLSFVVEATGEELRLIGGHLCDVKDQRIISAHTTKYESGVYVLDPAHAAVIGKSELSIGAYASAARILGEVKKSNADALFLNRFGLHDFRNKRQHTMKLNYSNLLPNDLIVGDGKQLDMLVISDDWKRVQRPWLFGWYDMATRRYCYELAYSETSEAIANSLLVAVTKWGIPKVVKHDNGKAYLSGRFDSMKSALNIGTELSTIKLARAKAIESLHNVIDHLLKTQIGYTGNNYVNCPQDTKDRLALVGKHQRNIEKIYEHYREDAGYFLSLPNEPESKLKHSKRRFMHISELYELLNDTFDKYHEKLHGGLQKDRLGKQVYNLNCQDQLINEMNERFNSPAGRYEYYVKKGFRPVYADEGIVAMYTLNYDIRTVQLKTGISFSNETFYHPKLSKVAGEKVLIRYPSINSSVLYVYHSPDLQSISHKKKLKAENIRDLKFFCIAEKQAMIDYYDESFRENLIMQRAEEKRLRGSMSESKPETNIVQMTGSEVESEEIRNSELELISSKKKPTTKFKSIFDD